MYNTRAQCYSVSDSAHMISVTGHLDEDGVGLAGGSIFGEFCFPVFHFSLALTKMRAYDFHPKSEIGRGDPFSTGLSLVLCLPLARTKEGTIAPHTHTRAHTLVHTTL